MCDGARGRDETLVETTVTVRPRFEPAFEVVERKGLGHPDTLCDAAAEALGRHLAERALERTGSRGHFNVDKALLVGGAVEVGYGGGRLLRPAQLILAGRADLRGLGRADELAGAVRGDLPPALSPGALEVEVRVNPPTAELAGLTSPSGVPLANDTSYAVVSLPRTPLETAVYEVERHLTAAEMRSRLPTGIDVKVLGTRSRGHVTLIVAVATLADRVASAEDYRTVVGDVAEEVGDLAAALLGHRPDVLVNQTPGPYLTVTGTSAEAGDDGQVGRGNGFGGLITPLRPGSGEAPAGKNPVSHVGKTYHAVAHDAARRLLDDPEVDEVTVELVSRIGAPVTEPHATHVAVAGHVTQARVSEVLQHCLHDWEGVRDRLLAGRYELF